MVVPFPFVKVFLESLLLKLRDFPLVFLLIGSWKAAVPTLAVASLHSLLRGLNIRSARGGEGVNGFYRTELPT